MFNSGKFLNEFLYNIVRQDFQDFELILIDGASTDNTLEVINAFKTANQSLNLHVLSEPDSGIYDAMNKGISRSKGQWLYFMGSDDRFFSPNVLKDIYDQIVNEYVDLIYGNVQGVTSKVRYVYDTTSKVLSTGIHHQSVFYKARLFKEIGKYDLRFRVASDYHFTLKAFLRDCYSIKYIDYDVAYYGEGGYSSQYFDYKFFSSHYKILAEGEAITQIAEPKKCLENSIYCCLYLAKAKENLGFAWANLLYYLFSVKDMELSYRVKTFYNMLRWTIKIR